MNFLVNALIAGTLVGIVTGLFSLFIKVRKISFFGVGIAHSLFAGLAIGYIIGISPYLSAFLFCIVISLILYEIKQKINEDASIGIIFSVSMAIGILIISLQKTYTVNLMGFLFGSILTVTRLDIFMLFVLTVIIIIIFMLFYKKFVFISFDIELSRVYGIKAHIIDRLFFVLIGIILFMGIRVSGIILASTLLILPGLITTRLFKGYRTIILSSIIGNVIFIIGGLFLSVLFNLPPGPVIIVTEAIVLFLVYIFTKN